MGVDDQISKLLELLHNILFACLLSVSFVHINVNKNKNNHDVSSFSKEKQSMCESISIDKHLRTTRKQNLT